MGLTRRMWIEPRNVILMTISKILNSVRPVLSDPSYNTDLSL